MSAFPSYNRNRMSCKFSRSRIDGGEKLINSGASMDHPNSDNSDLVKNSVLYREFLAEREQILVHKWLESEKAGHDIGFERALLDWIVKHRSAWREKRRQELSGKQEA